MPVSSSLAIEDWLRSITDNPEGANFKHEPATDRTSELMELDSSLISSQSMARPSTSSLKPSKGSLKRKTDLKFLRPKIVFKQLSEILPNRDSLEKNIQELASLLTVVDNAQKSFPVGLQNYLEIHTPIITCGSPSYSDSEALLPFVGLENQLSNLQRESNFCEAIEVTEDEWGERVVHPILCIATQLVKSDVKIDIATVKTITPELLPLASKRIVSRRKRVDYVLGLLLEDEAKVEAIIELVPGQSLNQCNHSQLRHRMLFSHIEVKCENQQHGQIQLGIWCAAAFKKQEILSQTVRGNQVPLATVPLWLWMEDTVTLMVAVHESPDLITIYEAYEWKTSHVQSLLSLIITLTWVMEWGVKRYLPWFKSLIGYDE